MTDESREIRLTDLTAAYLDHLESGAPEPQLGDDLSAEERADARVHIRLLRALWGADLYEPPPLGDDPVARRFGFNRVAPSMRVSGPRIRELRQIAGILTSELTDQLSEMGHSIDRSEMGSIERATSRTIPMSLATGLAAVLNAAVADFEAPTPPARARLTADAFTAHPLFLETVSNWSGQHHLDPREVARRQQERLRHLRHRGAQELTAIEWQALLLDLLNVEEP